jgi:Lipocalin-like domain
MHNLTGVWKLIEARAFDEAGRELPSPLGPEPMGVAVFGAARGMAMAGDSRANLPPEVDRAFAAYCGNYTFDGTELTTRVDGASSSDMLVDQVRQIRFDSPARMTVTPVSRLFGRSAGLEMVWERVE